jgi:hypothetical protein
MTHCVAVHGLRQLPALFCGLQSLTSSARTRRAPRLPPERRLQCHVSVVVRNNWLNSKRDGKHHAAKSTPNPLRHI